MKNMSYMYPVFPILACFGIVLCLFPVPAHWRAGNIATVTLAIWISIGNLICAIDVCIWHGSIANPYPIWGDIVQQYLTVVGPAIASCLLCIQYRLWSIARARSVFITKSEKRREKYWTWFFCIGIPVIIGGVHWVVQGHRYNLIEDLGPVSETYNVTLAYPLFFIWEPILVLISAVIAAMTIRLFLARRKEFDAVLDSGSQNINKDRYLRLLCLASVSICIHIPLSLWPLLVNSLGYTVRPWISWEDTHSNFGRIMYVTRFSLEIAPSENILLSLAWWSLLFCCYSFFAFFGFGEEASKQYQAIIGAILRPFGIKYPKEKRRKTIKRTWLDVLLCRPGRPINLTSSVPTSSMPAFKTNPSEHPSRNRPATRTQTTSGGANDMNIDISNLDFLDPAEARKQARISAYTRPGQAVRKDKQKPKRSASVDSSIHQSSIEGSEITEEKRFDEEPESPSSSTAEPTKEQAEVEAEAEIDLEAQQEMAHQELLQQRRREILEKNPELTEEISF